MRKDTAFIETHRSSAGGPEGGRGACSTWPEAAGTSCSDRNTGHRPERRNSTEAKCSPILGPILHDYSTSAKFILFQPASWKCRLQRRADYLHTNAIAPDSICAESNLVTSSICPACVTTKAGEPGPVPVGLTSLYIRP